MNIYQILRKKEKADKAIKPKSPSKKTEPFTKVHVNNRILFQHIRDFCRINKRKNELEKVTKELNAEIKKSAISKFTELFRLNNYYPGSLQLEATTPKGGVATIQFVPSDDYNNITEAEALSIIEEHGNNCVDKVETITVQSVDLLKKHEKALAEFLEKIGMNAEDFFKLETTYRIRKGTIEHLNDFGDCRDLIETFKVKVQLRNATILTPEPRKKEIPVITPSNAVKQIKHRQTV